MIFAAKLGEVNDVIFEILEEIGTGHYNIGNKNHISPLRNT